MRLYSTLHNHTSLCDGRSTPREMVAAALAQGFTDLGFSGHSPDLFDPDPYYLRDVPGYGSAIRSLAREYAGRLRIWCGLELDWAGEALPRSDYDFIIGSVHYVKQDGAYCSLDHSPARLRQAICDQFHNDPLALAQAYYGDMAEMALTLRPEIIGHFDLISKFSESDDLFDDRDPAYRRLALEALDAAVEADCVFEINSGAMARGWRTAPYPAPFLLRRLYQRRARITLSADCHDAARLTYGLGTAAQAARDAGFTRYCSWEDGGFVERKL